MYVCVCQAVTERQVREAAQRGVNSVKALKEGLGVAAQCAKCARCAHNILRDSQQCQEDDALASNPT
jgi:bacterioferritin-associated ferredoxin